MGGGSCALEAAVKGIALTTGRSSPLPIVDQRRLVDKISELLIGIGVILSRPLPLLSIDIGVSVVRGRFCIHVALLLLLLLLWASRVEVVVTVVVPVVLAAKIEQISQPATDAATATTPGSIVLVPPLGSTIVGVARVGVEAAATTAVANAAAGRLKFHAVGPSIEEGPVRGALRRTERGVVDVGGRVTFLKVAVSVPPAERG